MTDHRSLIPSRSAYATLSAELLTLIGDKDALHTRIARGAGQPQQSAKRLRQLLDREAAICQQLAELRACSDDVGAAYVYWSWTKYLRSFDVQRYVEGLYLAQRESDLDNLA